jgi:hypothetical protein
MNLTPRAAVNSVNFIFAILVEVVMNLVRLMAVVADGVVPFLGFINATYFKDPGSLLQISHPLRIHYIVWSSIFSFSALVGAVRWGEKKSKDPGGDKTIFLLGFSILLFALLVAVAYSGLLAAYDDFLRTTSFQSIALFRRNLIWSLALIVAYSFTFSLISLGTTLIAVVAYNHAKERMQLEDTWKNRCARSPAES